MLGRPVQVTITDNKAEQPSLIREGIPFLIAADPNNPYRIQLNDAGTEVAEFTCEAE